MTFSTSSSGLSVVSKKSGLNAVVVSTTFDVDAVVVDVRADDGNVEVVAGSLHHVSVGLEAVEDAIQVELSSV